MLNQIRLDFKPVENGNGELALLRAYIPQCDELNACSFESVLIELSRSYDSVSISDAQFDVLCQLCRELVNLWNNRCESQLKPEAPVHARPVQHH